MYTIQFVLYLLMIYGTSFFFIYLAETVYEKLLCDRKRYRNLLGGMMLGLLILVIQIVIRVVNHPDLPATPPDGRYVLILISTVYYGYEGGAVTMSLLWAISLLLGYPAVDFLFANGLFVYVTGVFCRKKSTNIPYRRHPLIILAGTAFIQLGALVLVWFLMIVPGAIQNYYKSFPYLFVIMEIYAAAISLIFIHNRDRAGKIDDLNAARDELASQNEEITALCETLQSAEEELHENYDLLLKKETQMRQLAYYDPETGLKNRSAFLAEKLVENTGIVFIAISHYDILYNTFGEIFKRGAKTLFAKAISEHLTNPDALYYVNSGLCAIILPPDSSNKGCAENIFSDFKERIWIVPCDNRSIPIRCHGIQVQYPQNGHTHEELQMHARAVISDLEKQGTFTLEYVDELMEKQRHNLDIKTAITGALERGELSMVYQPQLDDTGIRIIGFEALMRWDSRLLGVISPDVFIRFAEVIGMIGEMDEFALRESCRFIKAFNHKNNSQATISVNSSFVELIVPALAEKISRILTEEALSPNLLCLEITETAVSEFWETVMDNTTRIRNSGTRIHLDDFGTGYSSLDHLARLPVDAIKLDKHFIWDMEKDVSAYRLLDGIIKMGHELGLKTIAEGVETQQQFSLLKEMNCDLYQGYLFSKPISSFKLMEMPEIDV